MVSLVAVAIPLLLAALVQERQRAEEALRQSNRQSWQLAGRLMSAQEQERRHIARELHDNLSQKVAVLAISISNARRRLARH